MIIIDLIYNLALLAALSVISGFVDERWQNKRIKNILQGFLFGGIAVIGMLRPLDMGQGLIFDGRSVVISLCGLFFGPVSLTITTAMTMACRVYQGGIGAVMGVLVIMTSSILGLLYYIRYTRRGIEISTLNLYLFGIVVHLAMISLTSALPAGVALATFKKIAFPVMFIYPLATLLIGKIISDHITGSRNMEALKDSEASLQKSESYLRTLVQTIPDLIWLKDKDGVYLSCNTMFERFFGAKEKDIIGKTDYDFMAHSLADFFRDNDRKAIYAGKPVINEESITFADDGHCAMLETIKTPMFDDMGKLIGVLGIGRDITERKQGEEKIKNLLTEKELLLKEVHNRIKNNMSTIKGLLALQISAVEDSQAAASLKDAESRVQSMIMLYDRLYCSENFRELSVKDYLQSLAQDIAGSFPNRNIVKIKTEIEDFILNIQALTPLGIIVNELFTNIMKHAFQGRESGEIILTASMKDQHAVITIQDNGTGIDESIRPEDSSGFGLSLVWMLVEQIGGSIRFERDGGTKFILEFDV